MDLFSAMYHEFTDDTAPFQVSCPDEGSLDPRTPLGATASCQSFGSDGCISQGLETAPTITDIASNDELQWIVKACTMAATEPPVESGRVVTRSPPRVPNGIRTPRPLGGRRRRNDDLKLSPDEAEKRRLRRERQQAGCSALSEPEAAAHRTPSSRMFCSLFDPVNIMNITSCNPSNHCALHTLLSILAILH
uniref:Uncharacterized protein n=1 Tax=Eptatretus burgeri TaxID=7764 RepID=A0A8C4R4X4_EPTBU